MESLYQSPPYTYMPSIAVDNYHPQPNMYRQSHSFDRSFPMPPMESHRHHNHTSDPAVDYGWSHSSPSNHHHHLHHSTTAIQTPSTVNNAYGYNSNSNLMMHSPRPKITTNVWEDEGTNCYQVDAKGICVARRQDNDMINGTKLLNVVGMSRGKRDGILKNEKGRVVVKVGAMHLKGVWIPFERAKELAAKFKILDILFPLFTDEPSMYLCSPSIGGGVSQLDSTDVIPAVSNKCNMVSSPLPAFNNSRSDECPSSAALPTWDRPYGGYSHYNDHPQGPASLHRASLPDLALAHSPVPRPNHHHHHNQHHPHHQQQQENDLYLLNSNNNNNNNNTHSHPYDYYHRQFSNASNDHNRGSFSSVSSHQSLLYPSLQQYHEDEASKSSSVTTPTSYNLDNQHAIYNVNRFNHHEKPVYSPYTATTPSQGIQATTTAPVALPPPVTRTASAGSTTPSSWFSPETPTAVVFQQKDKEESSVCKKRKSSTSLEPSSIKRASVIPPTSSPCSAKRVVEISTPSIED